VVLMVGFYAAYAIPEIRANIVTNPGFEIGDLRGWTLSGTSSAPDDNGIFYGVDAADAHSGNFGSFFGAVGGVQNLTQNLATTPGDPYAVSFWLAQAPLVPTPYTNSFAVLFGGTTLASETNVAASPYAQRSFQALAASSSTTLLFAFRNDTGFFSLDDISVATSVPEASSFLFVGPALGSLLMLRPHLAAKLRTAGPGRFST
jgi:hypothetical protein